MGGIVCSAGEAAAVRKIVGPDLAVVTPGIRPAGAEHGDQKRVLTPARRHSGRREPSRGGAADRRRRPTGALAAKPFLPKWRRPELTDAREEKRCQRDTGLPMSMCATPKATRTMSRPRRSPSTSTAPNVLARGGAYEAPEGNGRARNVVIEFPSLRGGAGLLPFARVPGRKSDPPAIRGCGNGACGRRRCLTRGVRHCEQGFQRTRRKSHEYITRRDVLRRNRTSLTSLSNH